MPITIDGLISGLDTEAIVEGLLEIQQTQLDRIDLKRTDVLAEKSAFSTLEANLLTFRTDVARLARVSNSVFQRQSVTSSDDAVLTATASSSAAAGIYRLTVDSVAKAHQVASQGFADADSEITQGTLEFRIGSGDLTTITVDGTNNTLTGLAETINASGADVTASIIKDANGGASPYKLLLTARDTGADKAISLTNNLGASGGSAVQPSFDFGNPIQAAENAQVTLGSGPGAITVESSSNRFNELIDGVSIDVLNTSAGNQITLTVAQNNEAAVSGVQDFVDSFNDVMEYIDGQSAYDEVTEEGGILLGNRSVISIQQRLRNTLVSVVPGLDRSANRLSAIGISVDDNGRLELDQSKLESVLNGSDPDISRADIRRLFTLDASSSNAKVSFVLGTGRTQPASDVQVDLTQAAEKATVTAGTPLAATTVIDSSNRTLELELDGAEATITLDEGSYTQQELADHVELLINNASDLNGRSLNVGLSGGALTLTSDTYGRSSTVKLNGGTALTDLGFTPGTEDIGRDVAGTFIVNGVSESATGRGQVLSGSVDNEYTADLQVRVKLSPSEIVSGPEADLNVTRGLAATLDGVLDDLLDPVNGGLQTIEQRFDEELQSLQDSLDRQQALFDLQQESLIAQFVTLESALADLQSTSDFLGTQLAALQPTSSSSRN
ncbi:MAG: flagellar filament capping protein FliD [Fuerstiella sp.]